MTHRRDGSNNSIRVHPIPHLYFKGIIFLFLFCAIFDGKYVRVLLNLPQTDFLRLPSLPSLFKVISDYLYFSVLLHRDFAPRSIQCPRLWLHYSPRHASKMKQNFSSRVMCRFPSTQSRPQTQPSPMHASLVFLTCLFLPFQWSNVTSDCSL